MANHLEMMRQAEERGRGALAPLNMVDYANKIMAGPPAPQRCETCRKWKTSKCPDAQNGKVPQWGDWCYGWRKK